LEQDKRTLEQRYHSAVAGLYARLRSNYDSLYRKFGDRGIDLIAEMSREYGQEIGSRARKVVKGDDITAVGGYLLRIFNTVGEGSVVTENSDARLVIQVDRCPLDFTLPAMCLAHTEMEKAVVETLNPEITYRIGKAIPGGDAYCEHIVEYREGS